MAPYEVSHELSSPSLHYSSHYTTTNTRAWPEITSAIPKIPSTACHSVLESPKDVSPLHDADSGYLGALFDYYLNSDDSSKDTSTPGGGRYTSVTVLPFMWSEEQPHLGLRRELERLRHVFKHRFGYNVEPVYLISSRNPQHSLLREVERLAERHRTKKELVIVAYAGHGASPDQHNLASILVQHDGKAVDWTSIQRTTLDVAGCDVAMIMNCCYGASAAFGGREGKKEVLAAAGWDSVAYTNPSYIGLFNRCLEELAQQAQPFSLHHLHQLILRQATELKNGREKIATPYHMQLNSDDQGSVILCPKGYTPPDDSTTATLPATASPPIRPPTTTPRATSPFHVPHRLPPATPSQACEANRCDKVKAEEINNPDSGTHTKESSQTSLRVNEEATDEKISTSSIDTQFSQDGMPDGAEVKMYGFLLTVFSLLFLGAIQEVLQRWIGFQKGLGAGISGLIVFLVFLVGGAYMNRLYPAIQPFVEMLRSFRKAE